MLGASGGIGQPLSLLLKNSPLVSRLTLYDIAHTPGVAADLSHIETRATVKGTRQPAWRRYHPRCDPSLRQALRWRNCLHALWGSIFTLELNFKHSLHFALGAIKIYKQRHLKKKKWSSLPYFYFC